ncbi:MAG: hypothetical protein Q8M58_05090, partial [Anaerolineales bacterium]|nr:hypothetical protein [Anaerolineales bacterium]
IDHPPSRVDIAQPNSILDKIVDSRLEANSNKKAVVIRQFVFPTNYASCLFSLSLARRFKLTPDSAASIASLLCKSGGIRTINFPLYFLTAIGSGTGSPLFSKSATTWATT